MMITLKLHALCFCLPCYFRHQFLKIKCVFFRHIPRTTDLLLHSTRHMTTLLSLFVSQLTMNAAQSFAWIPCTISNQCVKILFCLPDSITNSYYLQYQCHAVLSNIVCIFQLTARIQYMLLYIFYFLYISRSSSFL